MFQKLILDRPYLDSQFFSGSVKSFNSKPNHDSGEILKLGIFKKDNLVIQIYDFIFMTQIKQPAQNNRSANSCLVLLN